MPNFPEQSEAYNDEIDLAGLIRALWKGKWLVIGVTLATLALGIAYLMIAPKSYTASLEINALNSVEAEVYALNGSGLMLLNDQSLLSQFVEEVQSKQAIESFIKSYGYIEQQADETDREFAFRIRQSVYNFDLVPPDAATNNKPKTGWALNISTHNPKLAFQIIKDALELSNQNVNRQLLTSFERRRAVHARNRKYAIEDIMQRKDRAIAKHNATIAQRLELLSEQALIARALKLSDGSLSAQAFQNSPTLVTASSANEPLYLKGYVALEKEIGIIKSRKGTVVLIEEVLMLDDMKLKLLQDQTFVRAEQRLAITPIGSDAFTAVAYDMASIVFKSNRKTSFLS